MKKILVIGPSGTRSKGGMATVINDIGRDPELNSKYQITMHESYIDGPYLVRFLFSIWGFIRFLFIFRKYDLFHIHMVSNGSTFRACWYIRVLRRFHKKVLLHTHVAVFHEFYAQLGERKKKYVSTMLKYAKMVIVLSEGWRDVFEKEVGLENVTVLNNGIDTDLYAKAISDPEKNVSELLFLGRIGERKGAYDLLEACKLLKDKNQVIHCVMAGDGEVEKFSRLAEENGLQEMFTFTGWISGDRKIDLLRKSAIVILPSHSEGLPMTLLEGMAAGKAIITTTVGSIPEVVINHENGIVLEPGNVKTLAEAMIYYKNHIDELKHTSEANIRKIENEYSVRKMHKTLTDYYEKVLNS